MRKSFLLFILYLSKATILFSQANAGQDKMVSENHPSVVIGTKSDPQWCYHWESIPLDPSLKDNSSATIEVSPSQTTIYKLTVTGTDFSFISTDEVKVIKFSIDYVRHTSGKEWKAVVGEPIEVSAEALSNCTNWVWDMGDAWHVKGGDMQTGTMKIPFSDLPRAKNSWFGDIYGTVTVSCKDIYGNTHAASSKEIGKKLAVFFDPDKNVEGELPSDSKPPCWYLFWKEGAVPGLEEFEYKHMDAYGNSEVKSLFVFDIQLLRVGIPANKVHYETGLKINNVEYGGAEGIDCCAEVVAHEKFHNFLAMEIKSGAVDNDPATVQSNFVGDGLPDAREAILGCNPLNKDTYNLAKLKAPQYIHYGDNEYAAIVAGFGKKGIASLDWSKNGKQW